MNMRDLRDMYNKSACNLNNKLSCFNQENSPSHGENVNIIIVTRKRLKNRKKQNVFIQAQQPRVASRLSRFNKYKKQGSITRHSSMPELNEHIKSHPPRNRSGHATDTIQNKYKLNPFYSKFIVNVVSEHRFDERLNPFYYPRQTKLKIYRCEVGGAEDNCCCSCNSDAMFEIMRSLYECYKKKDCRDCKCILCSHLPKDKLKFSEKEILLREKAMKGEPLPEGKTASEIKLINKVRTDLGLPVEPKTKEIRDKHEEAAKAGKLLPLEGKTPAEKEKILQDLFDMGIPLPKGRTRSEKALIAKISGTTPSDILSVALAPSEQLRRAKAEGLLTPLKGKTPEDREKILKGLAMIGLPLPEGQSPSENKLIEKVRTDLGLPIEPTTKEIRDKHEKAAKAGKLLPLEGKTPAQKEKILKGLHNMNIPLPVGRTPSEKSLIAKIAASPRGSSKASSAALTPSEQMRRAKAEGLMTSLKGKTPKQREKILKGLAMKGLPLPEPQSPSEKKIIKKVRTDLGVPVEPKTKAIRDKHEKAAKAGKLLPLEGKSSAKKEKILRGLHDMGIPLPVGRTPSEKSLIAKIAAIPRRPSKASSAAFSPSEQMRRAKAEGLLTSLKGKTPEQKEKIVKGLAMKGLSLPEAQSPSEKKLIDKVRADLGLPKDPTTKSMKEKYDQAVKAGLLQPLEGKTSKQKEKTLKGLRNLGIPLPEGRTPSEKALIEKVKASPRTVISPSEQLRIAKAEGLLTPLKGKPPEQKEKILKGLAMKGLPLPEAQSPSEKKLIDKVRADLGLPKDPTTKSMKEKHEKAAKAGLLQPLEGKTPAEKAKVLKGLRDMGIPLPEGRTPSEKALIGKIKESPRSVLALSEKLRRAKAEGLLTPLKGKPPQEKERIVKGLAMKGLPLPEAQSSSEQKVIDQVRAELGLPKEPTTKSMKEKHELAAKAGLLQPLEGKTPAEKAKLLKGLRDMGIPLPEGRTPSEKALIGKIKESPRSIVALPERLRRAKAEGLLTPLKGKSPEEKEKIVKLLAMKGLPLPEAQSPSDQKVIDKVRADLGLPKDPTTKSMKEKHEQAAKAGLLEPLEGKTPAEKAKILKGLLEMGIPLPEGRTPSEKALIGKVKESPLSVVALSEKLRRAKAEGLLTPLKGKSPEEKEKIVKALAMKGLPLPEAQSPSEKKLIDKVRANLGLPKDPTTKSMKEKHEQAAKAGLLQPLEGKTPAEKEKVLKGLRDLGIPLPEGRTPSEKALIGKVKESPHSVVALSEKLRRAKAEGLLTPLKGKSPEEKEKIVKALAMKGLPLPEAQSPSEKKLIDKVRANLGLPKDPTTKSMKEKHEQAAKAGLLQPLEGKTPAEKEKVLKGLRDLGIPLPEGRTPSEKALIGKVKESPHSVVALSEKLRRAKAEGLLTPLKGKSPEEKEKIVKALAMKGLPLPEAQSPSEKKLIDKVRADLGLPEDPTTKSMKEKHEQAAKAGLLQPLEGKTPAEKEKVLKGLRDLGIPLPEGRTPSEKALIVKVKASPRSIIAPSEQLRRAKAEGLLTPLKGKSAEEKEKIVKGLAMKGLLLPEAETPSEKKLIDKVRADLGLPKDPTTKSMKEKYEQAAKAGLLQPLEGKTPAEKAKVLKGLHDLGIPLPEGRTPSEKALIGKVKESPRSIMALSEKLRRAKAEGLLTPLKGKSPEEKEKIVKALAMKGLPLPEAQSPSEKKLIDKVRADLGLPKDPTTKSMKEKHEQAAKAGLLQPLEGKTPAEKAKVLKGLRDLGIPLPEGRTPSEKALIAKVKTSPRSVIAPSELLRRAKAEGLLTPLKGKSPEEKEKIVKALAMKGLPIPEAQSPSEKKLIDKVRADLGLPKDPTTKSMKEKHEQAAKAGLLQPLEGKTSAEKTKVLKGLRDLGIPLPEGRTPSEKALIAKIRASPRSVIAPSEQLRRAKAEGLLTPLKGKSLEEKEKIVKGLAMKGLLLPEAESPSEKKLIDKVRADLGLPKEPTTQSMKDKYKQAAKAGLLQPLEGKTTAEKENILKGLRDLGIPLPVGRTPSEKALIAKVKASPRSGQAYSEQLRKAKAEGLMTPLEGKTPEEKEKILKGLAMIGLPLPEGQSPSENKLINKVRADLGLPIEPKTKAIRDKHEKAAKAGKLLPLEGKTPAQKEKILKGLHNMGIPLPVGRTPSEKSLIAKIAASPRKPSKASSLGLSPSEQLRRAKAEGFLTSLQDKTPDEREKILKGLAMIGLPLPEGQSPSENKLIQKIRTNLGLPIEPKTKAIRDKHEKAAKAGKLLPLEGKTPAQKEKILKGLHNMGIPLPVGRTPSEKSLIAKIAASPRRSSKASSLGLSPSEQLRRAKAEGLLTPLQGKTPEEKEKILKGLAMKGLPLPEGQSPSENKLIQKVRTDLGVPVEPKTKAVRDKHEKAAKAGKLLPLEGKTPAQKEKILKDLHDMGIPLPIGRTPSEKSLIAKIAASPRRSSKASSLGLSPSEQLRRAKAEGLLTPLQGKTPDEKEKILKGLAMKGLPLPEGQSPSENKLIQKVRTDLGVPVEPKTKAIRDKHEEAAKAGKLLPLEGKTPAQKEKILKDLHDMGIPLPIGRTASEKVLIAKVMAGPAEKVTKQAAGIATEYEEIQKTTKCDRGCGCDKKKIRFKHSYVKIRVTSPDMASFCDCPDECLPGIKGGVFIDKDGIQVTVGSAVGVPSLTTEYYDRIPIEKSSSKTNYSQAHKSLKNSKSSKFQMSSFKTSLRSNGEYYILNSSCSVVSSSTRPNNTESDNIYLQSSRAPYEVGTSKSDRTVERCLKPLGVSDQNDITSKTKSTASSNGSILIIKSEMSLYSTISNKTMDTVSLMSIMDSSISHSSTHYSGYQSTDDLRSSSLDELTSNDLTNCPATIEKSKKFWNIGAAKPKREYTVLRMSQTRLNFGNKDVKMNKLNSEGDPVVLINGLPSKLDVSKIMNKIMSKKRFAGASSIYVVVPMSEDEEEHSSSSCVDSVTSIYSIESETKLKDTSQRDSNPELRLSSFTKRDENICGKGRKFFMKEVSSNETETMCQNESVQVLQRIEMANREFRPIRRLNEIPGMLKMAVQDVGIDANTIKPCCCQAKEHSNPDVNENGSSIITLSIQGCNHLPDMQTPSASLSDLHVKREVFTQTTVGCRLITPTSCSRLSDIRTPSAISLVQPCEKSAIVGPNQFPNMCTQSEIPLLQLRDSSSAMRSRILPSKMSGCCRLPDMRTLSTGSLDLSCTVHTQPSVGSSHFPHKTTSYYRLPDTSSTESPILEAPSSSDFDWFSLFLSGTYGCCYPRLVKTASTESSEHLSDTTMFSNIHVSLDDSWSHSAHLGYNRHKNQHPSHPPKQNQCKEISTPRSVPCFSSKEYKPPMCNKDRSSPIKSDLLRAETITPRINRRKSLLDITKVSASTNNLKTNFKADPISSIQCINFNHTGPGERRNDDIESTDIISDEISIRNLQIQTNIKSKMPIAPAREEYCLCEDNEDIESTNTITSEIPKQPPPLQSSRKSKMPRDSARAKYCLCEDIDGIGIISNEISIPKLQIQIDSIDEIKSIDSIDEIDYECEEIKGIAIIPDEMTIQKPWIQTSLKFKMPIAPAREKYCLCEDTEDTTATIIPDEILIRKPGIQTTCRSPTPIKFLDEEDYLYKDIEGTDIITVKISHQKGRLQASWKSKIPTDFAFENNCFWRNIESADIIKDRKQTNRKYKISIYSTNEEDCLCEDINEDKDIGTVNISSRKSKMPVYSTDEDDCMCEDIKSTNIITDKIKIRKPYVQATKKSKMPIDLTNEDHCLCNDIEDTIIDKRLNREPQLKARGKSKMTIDSTDGGHCLCDDVEGITERLNRQLHFQANQKSKKINDYTINDFVNKYVVRPDITSGETHLQANQKSKKLRDFGTKEYFVNEGVEHPDVITDKLGEYIVQQTSKDFVVKGICECQQQSKTGIKVNCKCQQQSKDSAIKKNCECQQQSNKPIIKENSEYQQQSKNFINNEFCACEGVQAIIDQVQYQARPSPKHRQIKKIISSVRKSISHKIIKTIASKISEVEKKSKKILKSNKISKKLQGHHSLQTMPEQAHHSIQTILQSQQMAPDAPNVPEVIYDGNPYEYNYEWIDIEELKRLRSELTETTSGFKVCKKRKRFRKDKTIFEKPEAEIELDFEDAIKYYVGNNRELFRDLIPQLELVQRKAIEAKNEPNKAKTKEKDSSKNLEEYKKTEDFVMSKDCCKCPCRPVPTDICSEIITLTYLLRN